MVHVQSGRQLAFQHSFRTPLGAIRLAGQIQNSRGLDQGVKRVLGSFALVYSLSGACRYWDERIGYKRILPGDMILLFPEIAHRYGAGEGETWDEYFVMFDGPVFDLWRQVGLLDPVNPIFHVEPIPYWLSRMKACVEGATGTGQTRALHQIGTLQTLLADLGDARKGRSAARSSWVEEACRVLGDGTLHPVNIDSLASDLGLTCKAFRQQFVRTMGMPPKQYRLAKCIDHACDLVIQGRLSGKEIADLLGFCDEYHFSKRFKQVTGLSPRAFRAQMLGS